jgi:protein-S-isoprenylcysteine O-methyltransferase Ste14
MSAEAAHRSYWETSDVVFGIPFLLGVAMQWVVPFYLPDGILRQVSIPIGLIIIAAGVTLVVLARREFAHKGQPTDPGLPTGRMVTTGVFSISRNPLYLGVAGVFVGVGLAFNLLWVLVLQAPALILCHYVLIAPEERYLAAKFGEDYQIYAASVHRWLGRAR